MIADGTGQMRHLRSNSAPKGQPVAAPTWAWAWQAVRAVNSRIGERFGFGDVTNMIHSRISIFRRSSAVYFVNATLIKAKALLRRWLTHDRIDRSRYMPASRVLRGLWFGYRHFGGSRPSYRGDLQCLQ